MAGDTVVGELWVPVPPLDPQALAPIPIIATNATAVSRGRTTFPNLMCPIKALILLSRCSSIVVQTDYSIRNHHHRRGPSWSSSMADW